MVSLDAQDFALLSALQTDGRLTQQQLAERIPLSASQIGRRLARLELHGVIAGYRIELSPEALGLSVTAFASVNLAHHTEGIVERFRAEISLLDEVLACYTLAGEAD